MKSNEFVFVIASETSRNSARGLRPEVGFGPRDRFILAADAEGVDFFDATGIEYIEEREGEFRPARDLTVDEMWSATVEKLNDDGRLFLFFEDSESGIAEFISAAKQYRLEEKARALVEELA